MGDNNNDDGLGLSLSLGLGGFQDQSSLHFNLMQQQHQDHHPHQHHHHGGGVFPSFDHATPARTQLKAIDMNVSPAPAAPPPPSNSCDEDVGVSSPNSTISSTSGKRSEREANNNNNNNGDDNTDEEDGGDGEGGRKKLRLSKEQAALLEETFKEHSTLNPKQKVALAKQLTLRPRQVEVWFQNRRARTKLKQTEVDCEYLKRCCENLTVENRRLQKEVAELRALKHAPQFYMNMTPPTTLTMCPSCEKVAPFSAVATSQHNQASTTIKRPIPINAWASKSRQATRL